MASDDTDSDIKSFRSIQTPVTSEGQSTTPSVVPTITGKDIPQNSLKDYHFNISASPVTRASESQFDFVSEGLTFTTPSGLTITMIPGVAYIAGERLAVSGISTLTLAPSRDYYFDLQYDGRVVPSDVANGGTTPALATGSIRLAKIVTGASTVSSITQTGIDTLNNQIYPNDAFLPLNWLSFVPTINNFTLGNGTKTGEYTQNGKTITGEVRIACGSTSAFGSAMSITPPVTPHAKYSVTTNRFMPVGQVIALDSGTQVYQGDLFFDQPTATGTMVVDFYGVAGTYANRTTTTATVPFTIASGDFISIRFCYEAL